jgi:hypothetical protein
MKSTMILLFCLLGISMLSANALSADDLAFLIEREQYQLINKYWDDFSRFSSSPNITERKLLLDYAQRTDNLELASDLHYSIARDFASLEDGLQWLILQSAVEADSTDFWMKTLLLTTSFKTVADSLVFAFYATANQDQDLLTRIEALPEYNEVIESGAKSLLDEISSQASSHEAIELIDYFYQSYPASKWHQAAFYLHLNHLANLKDYAEMQRVINANQNLSAAHAYIAALFWMSPTARRDQCADEADSVLNQNLVDRAQKALFAAAQADGAVVLYDVYDKDYWHSRVNLQLLKSIYYYKVSGYESKGVPFGSLYGDEPDLIGLYPKQDKGMEGMFDVIGQIHFSNNDKGELAEYYYWKGKVNALFDTKKHMQQAIKDFGQCLIYGSPRNRYDRDAHDLIAGILQKLGIQQSPMEYLRQVFDYQGIVFEDTHAFPNDRYTRVALGDYDNDGMLDILFNGSSIYRNQGSFTFNAVSDSGAVARLQSSGGLWADFNKDGILDFISISHAADGNGDALLKGQGGGHFVKVNAKAGEIDNGYPTEGAAFIDIDGKGFPSLYLANYETWQQRSGYPDNFYHNDGGYFQDESFRRGFHFPVYAVDPGLAGRGVAPADFDNDGKQEILVTNYRLMRNFLYKQADSLFVDVAALYGVAGHNKKGYYGHSIGADWADIDNDGDLDLFVANLAHPRFIDISDISQLFRNDGLQHRVVGADTLYYWLFTDITKAAGITFDELHSDPLFFDADNDGYVDLFITSVYENDRSYLYRNNGDGTFSDVTYLSGARIYNGWGCAAGDLNRNGKLDLVIGSGNGTKILANVTQTSNRSITLKPIHKGCAIDLIPVSEEMPDHPNSPAFGARVELWTENTQGQRQTLIRELSSAKGTTSQNAPELHFGLGDAVRWGFKLWRPEQ